MPLHKGTARAGTASRTIVLAVLAVALGPSTSRAVTVTVPAVDSGWYDASGTHTFSNENYVAGEAGFPTISERRNFFVFFLFEISGTVTSATLRIFNPTMGVLSPDPAETYTLFDVSTPLNTLTDGGTGLTGVFNDLGSGTTYGSVSIAEADENTLISIPLNAAAVSNLNLNMGGIFKIGGALTTLGTAGTEQVFAFTNDGSTRQLVFEMDPTCGNGILNIGEQCDDGNSVSGDCCSAFCHAEPSGNACASDGEVCSDDVCDGLGHCVHTPVAAGTPCRADAGECDVPEACDGSGIACPADGFEPPGTACTADAAACTLDQCDGAGTCAHPPTPAGTECRASAGICDPAEACDGTSPSCPADAKSTAVCRISTGPCDVTDSCDGAAPTCPPDTFAPSGTVCRGAAGLCDVAESCSGVGPTCPPDGFAPSETVCRGAVDDCDAAETCSGASPSCPADAAQPDGTGCEDGDACTQPDACSAGACVAGAALDCDDGIACTLDTCTPAGGCLNDGAPRSGCLTAQKSFLLLSQNGGARDRLVWKWLRGSELTQADLADPTAATDYALCVYAGTGDALIVDAALDGGGKWSAIGATGYKYVDAAAAPNGIQKTLAKAGAAGRSRALAKGRGVNLSDPVLGSVTAPVTAQLVNRDSGLCLESVFEAADVRKSTATQFKAKAR